MAQVDFQLSGAYKRLVVGHVDYWFGGGGIAYSAGNGKTAKENACLAVPLGMRPGKVVGLVEGNPGDEIIVDYIWHPRDTSDAGLVKKTSGVSITGTPNKFVRIGSDGESLEETGITEVPAARAIQMDHVSWAFQPQLDWKVGGLVIENKVQDQTVMAAVFSSRTPGIPSIEYVAYLSDISTPIDTTNLKEYEASTDYVKDETIFFTIDEEIFFYRVLQDFTSFDPVDIEAEITAGNLELITQGKFIKILDHDPTTKTIYTKYSVVKDPSSKVLYRAKQDADETIPLTNTTYWENITIHPDDVVANSLTENKLWVGDSNNEPSEVESIPVIYTNDATVNIFTVAYLIDTYNNLVEIGQWVECIQQMAQRTLTGWLIVNKEGEANAILDLSDTNVFSGAAGFETLDISSVNTATIFTLTQTATPMEVDVYKIVGGIEGKRYLFVADSTIISVTMKHAGSPSSNDIVCLGGVDSVITNSMDDSFEYLYKDSVNYQIK